MDASYRARFRFVFARERMELLSALVSILACSSAFLYSSNAVLRDSKEVFILSPAVFWLVSFVSISAIEPSRSSHTGFIFVPTVTTRLLNDDASLSAGVTVFSKDSCTSPVVSDIDFRISLKSSVLSPASCSAALPASMEPNISTMLNPFLVA